MLVTGSDLGVFLVTDDGMADFQDGVLDGEVIPLTLHPAVSVRLMDEPLHDAHSRGRDLFTVTEDQFFRMSRLELS